MRLKLQRNWPEFGGKSTIFGEISAKSIISNNPVFWLQNRKYQNLDRTFGYP